MPPNDVTLDTPSLVHVDEISQQEGELPESTWWERALGRLGERTRGAFEQNPKINRVLHAFYKSRLFGIDTVVRWTKRTFGEGSSETQGVMRVARIYEKELKREEGLLPYRAIEPCDVGDEAPWSDVTTGCIEKIDGSHLLAEVWPSEGVERMSLWVPLAAFPKEGASARVGRHFMLRRRSDGALVRLGADWVDRSTVDLDPVLRSIEARLAQREGKP